MWDGRFNFCLFAARSVGIWKVIGIAAFIHHTEKDMSMSVGIDEELRLMAGQAGQVADSIVPMVKLKVSCCRN